MNLKTTLILAILVVGGGITWLIVSSLGSGAASSETLTVLDQELTPAKITRIDVEHADEHVILEKTGADWSLPGKWPVRRPEVNQLVATLSQLHSRFAPEALGNPPDLKKFGLDGKPLTVSVRAGGKDYKLSFGEKPDGQSRFSWPTYVRLGDRPEVVRLAPGLVAVLKRPQDYYMQRQLFPMERIAKEGDAGDKVEQVAAKALAVKSAAGSFTLARKGKEWELTEPVHDRPDPDKLKAVLAAVPDVWAESFVDKKGKDLAEFGLKEPEQTLRVTRPGGDAITLLIGKQSKMNVRKVQKPGIPTGSPIPPPPRVEMVHDEYKYAKLQDNDQVFEIKADRLKDVALAADALRDPQVARFKTDDVKRVEIDEGGRQLVLVKDKDKWRLEKPAPVGAETSKVTELLDKLSGLQAREKDIIDKADPKTYGLDKPATIKLTLEGKDKSAAKPGAQPFSLGKHDTGVVDLSKIREPNVLRFLVGKHDTDKNKLYVQVTGWPRVNAVDADLLKLVQRPALAYRNRRVLDFATGDLAKVEVQPEKGDAFTLEQAKGTWQLAAPVRADIDTFKAEQLAGDLGRLEATEFITAEPKKEDLEKVYGLEKPALTVKAVFTDSKKPALTLQVGKQRDGKQEYYARVASDPAVFVIGKDTRETLAKDSLSYRPLELWRVPPEDIAELSVRKDGPEYKLDRAGTAWKISGPFEAAAAPEQVKTMTEELATLKAERYEAHAAKDLGKYGLDKPYLRVALQPAARKAGAEKAEPEKRDKERVLLIGKAVEKDGKGRYARLGDGEAVFVVGEKVVAAADHEALDLLERKLLSVDPASIQRIRTASKDAKFTLQQEKKDWRVTESPAPPFVADREMVEDALQAWSNLRAQKFAAYGDKLDVAKFGLDGSAAAVTVTVQLPGEKDKPGKTVEHNVLLGKDAPDGGRYARLDKGPGIVVFDSATVKALKHSYLDFVDHTVLKLDTAKVTGIKRGAEGNALELVKKGDKWQLLKPAELPADGPTLERLVGELSDLRAVKVAAYPAKEVAAFGLDKPVVVTLRVADDKGKPVDHVIQIGKVADTASGDRYARAAKAQAVVVLAGSIAKQLVAAPLQFRDRDLARVAMPDKVTVERGTRKVTFSRMDGTWKMTEPVQAETEQTDLEEFLKGLSHLRAEELVADKPGDLKPYGLDKPAAHWRFFQGAKEELNLLVGSKAPGKDDKNKRAYARLASGDVVFLLDANTTRRALAEYRNRKVWSPSAPDAAQVEKVHFGYAKDPFVLQKVAGMWQVAGKPEAKVKADAVSDALSALAGLQAESYVADRGADLKLYGLQPPELVLELETPSGKRTLHVGHQEGQSKRYYAAIPGAEGTPVFLLSEADARRIVRPLQAFVSSKQ